MAIIYKFNILEALKNIGYSTYQIRQNNILNQSTVTKLRNNETTLTLVNINKLCKLLDCQPGDLLEYVPDEEVKEENTQEEVPIKKDEEIKSTTTEGEQEEKEKPKGISVREMKKVAQIRTPIKLKLKKPGNKNQNIL